MKPRRLTTANHLAAALDRVTAENARLVQSCEALVADRDAAALAERERIAEWMQEQGERRELGIATMTWRYVASQIKFGEHLADL